MSESEYRDAMLQAIRSIAADQNAIVIAMTVIVERMRGNHQEINQKLDRLMTRGNGRLPGKGG